MPRPTEEIGFLKHIVEPIADDIENELAWSIRRVLEYVDEMEESLPEHRPKQKRCDVCLGLGTIQTYSQDKEGTSHIVDKCYCCNGKGRLHEPTN